MGVIRQNSGQTHSRCLPRVARGGLICVLFSMWSPWVCYSSPSFLSVLLLIITIPQSLRANMRDLSEQTNSRSGVSDSLQPHGLQHARLPRGHKESDTTERRNHNNFGYVLCPFAHSGSVQFSCSVVSNSLRPHESQHGRPPCSFRLGEHKDAG